MRRRGKQRANCVCCSTFRSLIFVRAWGLFFGVPHCAIVPLSLPSPPSADLGSGVPSETHRSSSITTMSCSPPFVSPSGIIGGLPGFLWPVVSGAWLAARWGRRREALGGNSKWMWFGGGEKWGARPPRGQGSKRLGLPLAAAPLPCSQSRALSRCRQGSYRHPALHLSMRTPVLSTLFAPRGSERERRDSTRPQCAPLLESADGPAVVIVRGSPQTGVAPGNGESNNIQFEKSSDSSAF